CLPISAIGPHPAMPRRGHGVTAARPARGSLIMRHFKETPTQARARYLFVGLLFLVLMALAHGAAQLNLIPVRHGLAASVNLQRVIFTIWVTIALLTPALAFHVFSRSDAWNTYWRAFWTFAYFALLTHLYWAIFGTCGGNFALIFDQAKQVATKSECIVEHPKPDFFLAAWGGFDVLLAWLVARQNQVGPRPPAARHP